jgi:hypothetical protein
MNKEKNKEVKVAANPGFHIAFFTTAQGDALNVFLQLSGGSEPQIVFARKNGALPLYEYSLSGLLNAMLHRTSFTWCMDDDDPIESAVTLSVDDVQRIGKIASSMLSPFMGRYALAWAPFNPQEPF